MAKPRSTLRRVLTVVIGVPVALVALYLLLFVGFFILGPSADDYSQRLTFDGKAWRDGSLDQNAEWPTRQRIVDDLVAKRRLDGLTREQLLTLLGPADQTDMWRDWHVVYWLGRERTGIIRADSEWLVIRFDAAGRVASYRIIAD